MFNIQYSKKSQKHLEFRLPSSPVSFIKHSQFLFKHGADSSHSTPVFLISTVGAHIQVSCPQRQQPASLLHQDPASFFIKHSQFYLKHDGRNLRSRQFLLLSTKGPNWAVRPVFFVTCYCTTHIPAPGIQEMEPQHVF